MIWSIASNITENVDFFKFLEEVKEGYLEHSRISKIDFVVKIGNCFHQLNVFAK